MSTCIFFDPGEKASIRPVMRSSKRAPMQIIRSQSCIDQLASQVPCMPSMPSHCGSAAGNAPKPISVEVMGKPVSLTSSRNDSLAARPGIDDAAAGVEQRALGRRHQRDGFADLVGIAVELRPVALVLEFLGLEIGALGELHVLGNIDHDRPGPAARGDVKRLVQRERQVGDGFDEIIVFGARPGDADGIAFLKRIVADEMGGHLAGDDDERDGVAERVGQAGDGIGGARPRGDQHGADLAGRARIALGGMHRALLVAHQDVLHLVLLEYGVVDRQHGAAGIAENVLDALIGKRRYHHFCAGHLSHRSLHSVGLSPYPCHACGQGRRNSGNKKGPLRAPGSRTATFRGWDHPPPAVRLVTRISDVAVRTCRPFA